MSAPAIASAPQTGAPKRRAAATAGTALAATTTACVTVRKSAFAPSA